MTFKKKKNFEESNDPTLSFVFIHFLFVIDFLVKKD